jgi:type IV pilus assembly protein PilQ
MVKVGSMRRANRFLLIASVLVVVASGADASLWRRHKADSAAPAAAQSVANADPAAMSLVSVDVDGSRVALHTSGTPAYTSYSPSPEVFVIDLTGTGKASDLRIPAALPAGVTSVTAEDAVEMGNRLTRVTFRFAQPMTPTTSAGDKAVIVALPVVAAAESSPAPQQVAQVPVVPAEVPHVEPVAEAPHNDVPPAPVVTAEALPLPKATTLRAIEPDGSAIRITGNGEISYKAFRLNNPERVVLDLTGVRNAMARKTIDVNDAVVKRVRVAQFSPDVTRVVLDLGSKTTYDVARQGESLVVTFGGAPVPAASTVTVAEPAAPGAKAVITAQADQTPPPSTTRRTTRNLTAPATGTGPAGAVGGTGTVGTAEDVFNDQTPTGVQAQGNVLTGTLPSAGGRTLSPGSRVYTGEPISLNLKDADIKDVLRTFAQLTGLNIAVDPGVGGVVTVDFVDVPWDQALDLILRQNNLTFTLEGNVMRIGTLDRIAAETVAARRLEEEERLRVPLTTLSFKLSYARAADVQTLLRDIASPRARIIVDTRTNQLIVSEIPEVLRTMQNLIVTVDIPTKQVVIEARIVETTKNFLQQYGFNWGFRGNLDPALGTGTGLVFPNTVDVTGGRFEFGPGNPVLSLVLSDVLGTFNLDLALNAAETEGLVKVISAPKVTTQDNTSAEIQSGFQIPYQTRVNFTTTITYVDATLRLSVTPQITEAGTVIMDIQVQKNEPATGLAVEGGAGTPLSTRQARTKLMVRDGGTSVIAGIYQTKDNNAQSRLPFVHQIPIIGNLFKTHNISSTHDELLIFITPRIVRS